jgi:hypothetical protein
VFLQEEALYGYGKEKCVPPRRRFIWLKTIAESHSTSKNKCEIASSESSINSKSFCQGLEYKNQEFHSQMG